MTVKMIQYLGNKMEAQINRMEIQNEKIQEMINNDIE